MTPFRDDRTLPLCDLLYNTGPQPTLRLCVSDDQKRRMTDPDARETGFYWIQIGDQEPEVAQWQAEWDQWLVIGQELPLSDVRSEDVVILSGLLAPPMVIAHIG